MKISFKFLFFFTLSFTLSPLTIVAQENNSDITGSITTNNNLAVGDNTGLPQITQDQANEDGATNNKESNNNITNKENVNNTSQTKNNKTSQPEPNTQAPPSSKENQTQTTYQEPSSPDESTQERQNPISNAPVEEKKDLSTTQTLITSPPSAFFNEIDESALPLSNQYGFKLAPYKRIFFIKKEFYFQLQRFWENPKILWFFVHNSEEDAKMTLQWAVLNIGGYGLSLVNQANQDKRDIRYFIRGVGIIELDPNRIFTQKGILQNLSLLNKTLMKSHSAHRAYSATWKQVSKPSTRILMRYWNKNRPLIALHNNRILTYEEFENNPIYSITTFPEYDKGTFIITNIKRYYTLLKKQHLNVILQKKLAHDGSLSDLAFLKKYPYINIETRMGNQELQKRIAYAVTTTLFPNQITKPRPPIKKKRSIQLKTKK